MSIHFGAQFRNPLAYPAGYAPGFDPSHPAAKGIATGNGYSAVASGGNFISLSSGIRFTVAGSAAPVLTNLGTGVSFGTGGTAAVFIDNQFNGAPTYITLAAIFKVNSLVAAYQGLLNHVRSGVTLVFNSSNILELYGSSNSTATNLTLVDEESYFAAVSGVSGGVKNFVLTNLNTGKALSQSVSDAVTFPSSALTASYVGNNNSTNQSAGCNIHAAMVNNKTFLSMPQLLQWAADPWSFWYPNPGDNWIGAQASGFPYWGVQNNNFVIGTGVQ